MRSSIFVVVVSLSLVFAGSVIGQVPQFMEGNHHHEYGPYPIHITDLINTPEFIGSAIEETMRRNPELYHSALDRVTATPDAVSYDIGDEEDFYVLIFDENLRSGPQYTAGWFDEVTFRLMAIGDYSYIWVSVEEINNGHVTQNEVGVILNALEESTPPNSRNPDQGIFELVNEYFGMPPNYGPGGKGTGDGKTNVLITDILDGWDPAVGGGYIAGFFFGRDQTNLQFSNQADIIYIDSFPGIFNPNQGEPNPERPLNTLAHEYQHLVFHNYRGTSGEETWLNEGLSEFSEWFCGFSLRPPNRYFSNTNRSMRAWAPATSEIVLQDYSRVALWTLYLWEQLGDEYIKHLVQLPVSPYGRGISIVNAAADQVGSDRRFPDLFRHFNKANYLKDRNIDERYGYDYKFDGRPAPKGYHNNPNVVRTGIPMPEYSSYFIEYTFGDSLEIEFSASANLTIKAIEVSNDVINVIPVSIGDRYIQYDYGDVYRTIMFVVINTNSSDVTFGYSSRGGVRYYVDEYAFDDGVPRQLPGNGANFFRYAGGPQNIGAGWAVQFTPEFPINQLIQARIFAAFQHEFPGTNVPPDAPKSFRFHVWGDDNGKPGDELIEPFVYTSERSDFTGDFIDIDLFDYAEELTDIQGRVYVGFTHNTEHWVAVGLTNLPDENRTFGFHPNNPGGWERMFDMEASGGIPLNGWNLMMRTVFAVYDPDRVFPDIPIEYTLRQNYPNPFNQKTTIEFELNRDAQVNIDIYDVLGRKVRSLFDGYIGGGGHSVEWNATDNRGRVVSSGVYFYRISVEGSSTAKKMIYLR